DEELDELGAADREERHVRLAGHGLREQRLAGARRTYEQYSLRQLAAEFFELARLLQELDDLLELFLRLVRAGDVAEGDARLLLGVDARPALRERHHARAGPHASHRECPDADEDDRGKDPREDRVQEGALVLALEQHALLLELGHELIVRHAHGDERLLVARVLGLELAPDQRVRQDDTLDPSLREDVLELGVRDLLRLRSQQRLEPDERERGEHEVADRERVARLDGRHRRPPYRRPAGSRVSWQCGSAAGLVAMRSAPRFVEAALALQAKEPGLLLCHAVCQLRGGVPVADGDVPLYPQRM